LDDALAGFRLGLRVKKEREGRFGGESVDVSVDFLDVEKDAGEGGGEVERSVRRVVGGCHEGIGK